MKTPQENPDGIPESSSPKSKKPRKVKKTTKKESDSSELSGTREIILTNPEDIEMLEKLLDNQADSKLIREYKDQADIEKNMSILKSLVEEYLGSFIILGYTIDGTRITIKNVQNDRDDDALIEQLRYLLLQIMNNSNE